MYYVYVHTVPNGKNVYWTDERYKATLAQWGRIY